MRRKPLVVETTNLLCICASQYVDYVTHTKTLFGSRNTGEEFLGVDCAVFHDRLGGETVIASTAIVNCVGFAKVSEQGLAAAHSAFAVCNHLLNLSTCNKLLLLVYFILKHKLKLDTITSLKEEHALCW